MAKKYHEPSTGETSNWLTPKFIFDGLKLTFDLDPAHPGPEGLGARYCVVPTRRIYTEADDGLRQPWDGLVFMNPPFGKRNKHVPWLCKFLDHGNGIAIVRAYTSSGWFHAHVVPRAQTLLFPKGKTQFIRPDGSIGKQPGHGVVLIGMGEVANAALERSGLGFFVRVRSAPPTFVSVHQRTHCDDQASTDDAVLHQDDDANELAHAIVAKVLDIVHREAPPDFRWSESANLELCRVRNAFAAKLRAHLRDHEIRAQREWRTGRLFADQQRKG